MKPLKKLFLPRLWGEKIILIIVFFLFTLFFTNDFGLIDIQKTAIILAAGVDKTETGKYGVTAQIAVPQASKSGGQTAAVAFSGEGDTVAEAFKEINAKTGWFPKLIFCDLIVLGEEAAQENVFDALGYFLRNEYMSDNCLLATCEGKAEELFNVQSPTDNMSALALQKVLATEAKAAGNCAAINVKDFSVGYFSEHKSGYMPYIRTLPQAQGGQQTGENASAGKFKGALPVQSQGGSQEKSGGNEKIFDASRTAVFYEGKRVGVLTPEQSFALNLVHSDIRQATLEVPFNDKTYALTLAGVSSKIDFRVENNTPRLSVSLKATARISDCTAPLSVREIAATNAVPPAVLTEANRILQDNLAQAFETCRAAKCDVFETLDKLRKYERSYHNAYKDVLLERLVADFSVGISDAA